MRFPLILMCLLLVLLTFATAEESSQVNETSFATRITGLFADNIAANIFSIGAKLTYNEYLPLGNAQINLYRNDEFSATAFTDDQGNVFFNSTLPSGLYVMNVSFPGREDITGFGIFKFLSSFNITFVNNTQTPKVEVGAEPVQLPAKVGEPVRWVKKIKAGKGKGSVNFTFEIPKAGQNVVVKDLDSGNHFIPKERKFISIEIGSVKKNRTFEFSDVIDDEKEYLVEFETPAPEKREEIISEMLRSKRIIISSDIDLHYVNVSASTRIKETAVRPRLYHFINESFKDITENEEYDVKFFDTNEDGLYDTIEWNVPHLSEQLFEIGLATINTKKSIYRTGENADIIAVVLDNQGRLVRDALVEINITTPAGLTQIYTDQIAETSTGIYEVAHEITEEGNYSITVSAQGQNVDNFMRSYFIVDNNPKYEILRNTPVTTDPWKGPIYTELQAITYSGEISSISEFVPIDFEILDNGGAIETTSSNKKVLTWNNIVQGETVSYIARPPLVTPQVWELRSSISTEDGVFDEARPWILAVDPQDGIQFSSIEEVDVAMCSLSNTSFVLAWVESGADPNDNLKLAIYNTDGTINQSAITVYPTMNNLSRVACATINQSQFVLSWYAQPLNDVNVSMYDKTLTRLQGPTLVDGTAGAVGDISVDAISSTTVGIGWADDGDSDFNYKELTWTTWALGGEVNIDINMNPVDSLADISDVAAISGNRIATVWFDDGSNVVSVSLRDSAGNSVIGATTIGVVGETTRLAATALRDDRIAYAYFNLTSYSLYLRIDDFTGDTLTPVLAPTIIDLNASETNSIVRGHGVSIAEIERDGSSLIGVAWYDGSETSIKTAVYDSSGVEIRAPFNVSSVPDNSYRLIDILGSSSNRNVTNCNGTFIVALSNSTNVAEIKGFKIDGTSWDGRCFSRGPNITLNTPLNATHISTRNVNFTFIPITDYDFAGCRVFTNITGVWDQNKTNTTRIVNNTLHGININFENDYHVLWNIECNDSRKIRNFSIINRSVFIDTAPPIIALTSFTNNTYVQNGTLLVFNFSVVENANDTCQLWGNFTGTWALNQTRYRNFTPYPDIINFPIRINLSEGKYIWNVYCNDSANNSAFNSTNFTINIDETNPLVAISKPANNSFNQSRIINITYSLREANLDTCSLWTNASGSWALDHLANSTEISTGHGQNFTFNGFDGHFMVNVTCNDSSGRYAINASDYKLFIDTVDPVINFINATGNTDGNANWSGQSNIVFYANVTENNTDTCRVYINQSGLVTNISNVSFAYTTNSLSASSAQIFADGSYLFNVTCNDSSGRRDFTYGTSVVFNIDTIAPRVAIRSPNNDSFNSSTVNFRFAVTDNNLANCSLYTNATGTFAINYSASDTGLINEGYNFTMKNMHDGSYLINISCIDRASNSSSNATFWTVSIDTVNPLIDFISPTPPNATNLSTRNFFVNVSHTEENRHTAILYIDGLLNQSRTYNGTFTNFTVSISNDGNYTYYVWLNDSAGNINFTLNRTLIIDATTPTIDSLTPENNSWSTQARIDFNFTPNDFLLGVRNCSLIINGSIYRNLSPVVERSMNNISHDFSNNAEGFEWNIRCVDTANNTNTTPSRLIKIDTTLPWMWNETSNGTNFQVNDRICLNISVADTFSNVSNITATIRFPVSGLVNLSFSNNTAGCRNAGGSVWVNNTRLTEVGDYNWTITYVTDYAGNVNATVPSYAQNWTATADAFINVTKEFPFVNITINESTSVATSSFGMKCNVTCSLDSQSSCENVTLFAQYNNGAWSNINTVSVELQGNLNNRSCDILAPGSSCNYTVNVSVGTSAGGRNYSLRCRSTTLNTQAGISIISNVSVNDFPNATFTYPKDDSSLNGIKSLDASASTDDMHIVRYVFELDGLSDFSSPETLCDSADANCTFNTFIQQQCANESSSCFLRLNVTDNMGLWNSTNISIVIDNSAPVVRLVFPLDNAWNNTAMMSFKYNGTGPGISACDLFNNGTGSWRLNETNDTVTSGIEDTIIVTHSDGSIKWNVRCNDSAGNSAFNSTNYTVNIDSTPPRADYASLTAENNSYHNRNWIFVNVTSFDYNFANITLYLFNQTHSNITIMQTANASINYTNLTNGIFYYNASASDMANNINITPARTITLDSINPSNDYGILTEPNNTFTNRNWVFVNVTGNDTNEANITFMLVNDTHVITITTQAAGTRSFNFTPLNANVTYYYNVTIEDFANNKNTTPLRTITLDSKLPNIEYINGTEANNTYFNRNYIYINASGFDLHEANITFMLVNESHVVNSTTLLAGNRSINFSNINSNMVYIYNITLTDKAGNTNTTRPRTITLDSTNPVVSLNEPINNAKTATSDLQFNYTPTDTNVLNCTIHGNFTGTFKGNESTTSPVSGIKNSLSPGPISDGYYAWNVLCYDRANNSAFAPSNLSLLIDATDPGLFTLHMPLNGTESTNRTPLLNWTPSYEISFLNYTVLIDNDPDFSSIDFTYVTYNDRLNITINMTDTLVNNAKYYWKVIAYDQLNHSNESNSTFVYTTDSILPAIYLIEPANNSVYNESTIDFFYNVTDNNTIANCTLFVNNTAKASEEFPVKNTSESLGASVGAGDNGWNISCTDKAGNTNQSELFVVTVSVDPAHEGGIQFSNLETVDLAMCPLTNRSFVLAWVESGADPNDNIRVAVYNTDGSVNKSSRIAYQSANNLSRVDCATINETQFVLAWYAQAVADLNVSMYDSQLTRLQGPTFVDGAAGAVSDISIIGISDTTVGISWVDDGDNDFNYAEITWTTWTVGGEVNVDNNMNPVDALSDLSDLAAVSGNRVAGVWFDDFTNVIATSLLASDGTSVIAQTTIGTVSEVSRVSAAGLRDDRVASAYFNSTDYSLNLRIDDFSGDVLTPVLAPTRIDINISETATIVTGHGVSVAEVEAGGISMVAVAWFDGGESSIKAAVYDSNGVVVTSPFNVSRSPDNSYRLVNVMGANSNRNVTICNGTFIVAMSNSTNVAEFRRFRTDGAAWNGICINNGPNITLKTPLNGSWNSSRAVNFTFTAVTDDDISGCRVWHNATGWGINNSNTSAVINNTIHMIFANFTEDYHLQWNVECNDSRRLINFSTANYTLYIDSTPPRVNLTAFRNNSFIQDGTGVLFNFTLIENANDTCELWGNFTGTWRLNQTLSKNISARDTDNDPQIINFLKRFNLDPGEYIWNVWCNDSALNSAFNATNFTLKIDTVDPLAGIFKPLNNTFNQSRSINLTFNYTEENLDSCSLWTNATGSWAFDHSVNYTQIALDGQNMTFIGHDGSFIVNISCNDSAGRYSKNASFYTLSIDTTPPVINFINATGYFRTGNWSNTNSITFYLNATENNTDTCRIFTNATGSWQQNTTFGYSPDSLSSSSVQIFADGSYLWNATCNDSARNSDPSFGPVVLNIDTINPVVSLLTPLNNSFNKSSSLNINVTFGVVDNNLDSCAFYTNYTGLFAANYSATSTQLNAEGFNFSFIGARDGSYIWNVLCNDSASNRAISLVNYTIHIDTTSPVINSINQSGYFWTGNWSSNGNITFYVNATEHNVFNSSCLVYTNATGAWTLNNTFSYNSNALSSSLPQVFADGSYLWNISCNDSASNIGQGIATVFNVDTIDPASGIFKPLNNSFNTSRTINLTYNFTEINIESCSLWTNASGSWAFDHSVTALELTSGHGQNFTFNGHDSHFLVNVTCNDSSGRYSRNASYYQIIIDTVSPLINFINATGNNNGDANWTAQSNIQFYVNASENNTDSCIAYVNISGWSKNTTFSYISNELSSSQSQIFSDGSYMFNVTCNDSAAQSDVSYGSSVVFNVDTVSPVVAIRNPANNTYNSTNNINVQFAVTENNLANCSLYTNATGSFIINYSATAANLSQQGYNFTLFSMHDSNYLLNVTCVDYAGNYSRNASDWTVIIDSVSPFINFINATGYSNQNWSSQADIRFYVNATDNNTESCRVYTNSTGQWTANVSLSYISNALSASSAQMFGDGSYLWNMTCNDSAANSNHSYGAPTPMVLNVDTVSPFTSILSPLNDSRNGSSSVSFRFNVVDNNLANCSIYTNATGTFAVNYSAQAEGLLESGYNFTLFNLHDHAYLINISCIDRAGNYSRNASFWTVTIDTTPPLITFINATGYANNNWSAQSNIIFATIANDASPKNCTVFTNATGFWRKNVTFGYSSNDFNISQAQIFADGSYLWNVTCNDSHGRFNSSYGTAISLNVDTVAPVVAVSSPLNGSYNGSSTMTIRFAVTEQNLANCTLFTNVTGSFIANYSASAAGLAESGYNFTVFGMHDASYLFNISCVDRAANHSRNASFWTITIDTGPPTISLNYPIDGYNTSNSTVTFNWTATDSTDTVLNCDIVLNSDVNASVASNSGEATVYALPGVGGGFNYWNITCRDDALNSNTSIMNSFVVVKGPGVLNISVTSNNNSIYINWTNVSYADYFDIYITTNHSQFYETPNVSGIRDSNWTDISANSSKKRFYRISSVRSKANSTSALITGKDIMSLRSGWNLVSIPLSLNTLILRNHSNNGFDPIVKPWGCITEIWRYNETFANLWEETIYTNGTWTPVIGSENFTSLSPGAGYWFYNNLSQECNFTMAGVVPNENTTKNLVTGFNIIGWYSEDTPTLPSNCENPYPFNVSPANAISILYYYNETQSVFKGTMHFTSSDCGGDESWGWFPDSRSTEFTRIYPQKGYYASSDFTTDWIMESSR